MHRSISYPQRVRNREIGTWHLYNCTQTLIYLHILSDDRYYAHTYSSVFTITDLVQINLHHPAWLDAQIHLNNVKQVPDQPYTQIYIYICCSVTQLCLSLCHLMDCSTPGLPCPHHLPESAQVHVHWFSDAFLPSHPLMPSPFALNFSSIRDFSNESFVRIRCPNMSHYIMPPWLYKLPFPGKSFCTQMAPTHSLRFNVSPSLGRLSYIDANLIVSMVDSAISSSATLFSFCPLSFPASGTFPICWLFSSDDQNTGASAQASVFQWIFRIDFP